MRPGARLADRVAVIVVGRGPLVARLPARHVVGLEHALVPLARGVHHLGLRRIGLDRFGDEALVERAARRLDLPLAVAAGGLRLLEDARVGVGEGGLRNSEPAPARFRPADRVRRRTSIRCGTRTRHRRSPWKRQHQRKAVARIADRRRHDVRDRHRAVVAQHQHPRIERAGNAGREQAGAGHEVEALAAVMRDRRSRRARRPGRRSRAAGRCLWAGQDRGVAAGAVHVRLDHLQHEAGRRRGVERVAARSRITMPTCEASQCVEATTPNVPAISGRVVNGAGEGAAMCDPES